MLVRNRRLSIRVLRGMRWQHEKKTPFFTVRWNGTTLSESRYAVSVPLRVSKTAPIRNRLRRLVFAALHESASRRSPDAIFIVHHHALAVTPRELQLAVKEFIGEATPHTP